ncbi:uncharacterized protein LOC144738062 [Lampetra planeri]
MTDTTTAVPIITTTAITTAPPINNTTDITTAVPIITMTDITTAVPINTTTAITTAVPINTTTAITTAVPIITTTATTTAVPIITTTATTTAVPIITTTAITTAVPIITTTATTTAVPIITTTATTTAVPIITTTATTTAVPINITTYITTAVPIITTTATTTAVPINTTTATNTAVPINITTAMTTAVPINITTATTTVVPINITTDITTAAPIITTTAITTAPPINITTATTTAVPIHITTAITTAVPINTTNAIRAAISINTTTAITTDAPINTTTAITTAVPINTTTAITTATPIKTTTAITTAIPITTTTATTTSVPIITTTVVTLSTTSTTAADNTTAPVATNTTVSATTTGSASSTTAFVFPATTTLATPSVTTAPTTTTTNGTAATATTTAAVMLTTSTATAVSQRPSCPAVNDTTSFTTEASMQIETDAPIGSGNCSFEFIVSKQNVTSSVTVLSWCVLDGPQTRCHCGPGLLWSAAACRQVGACDDAAASGPSPSPGSAPSSYSGSSFFPSCTCIKGLPPDGVQCVPRPEPLPSCTTANPTDATTVLNATAVAAVVVNATATTEMTLNATATTEMTLNATVTSETTLNATVTTAVVLNTTATTTVVLNTTATTAVVLNTTATPVLGTTMATGGSNHTSSPYAPQDLKVVPVTLTISEVFNSALSDPNSLDYRTMSNRLLPSLTSSYQSLGSRFVQVAILNFRPGSVLASVNVSGYSLTDSEVTNLTALAIDALIAAGVPVIRDFNINGTTTNVTTERLNEILNQSKDLQNQPKEVVEREVPILLQNLTMQTNPVGGSLTPDSIRAASAALGLIAMATQNKSIVFGKQVAESFLVTASNLLAMSNLDSWKSLQMLNQSDSSDLLGTVETFVTRMNTTSLATGTRAGADVPSPFNITSANVRLLGTVLARAGAAQWGNYSKVFAGDGVAGETAVTIGEEQLNNVANDRGGGGGTYVVSMLFTTLAEVLPLRLTPELNGSGAGGGSAGSVASRAVGSHILSTVVSNPRNLTGVTDIVLRFPLTVANNGSGSIVHCTFWDTKYNNGQGGWSGVGCQLTSTVTTGNATAFSCRCNHTTSFSILISPGDDLVDDTTLSIVSYVGVGISMLSLVAVLAIEAVTWRPSVSTGRAGRRSNRRLRHLILVNVCTSLLFADVWFIVAASPDALGSPTLCTAAAFFVHLGYLALFFWMLCEGLLLVYVVVVVFERFAARSLRAAAFAVGYGVPAVIAAAAVAATYPRGAYLRDGACWLDWEHGRTLFAFVAPAFAVLAANLVALALVLAKVSRKRSAVVSGSPDVNVRLVARSVGVLTPLLGVTWGLGIFAFSAEGRASHALHYFFAILNSLQGLFILIFNCLLDKEVRKELKKKLGLGTQKSKGTSSTGLDRVDPPKSHSSESREPEMEIQSMRPSRKDSIKFLHIYSDYQL